MIRSFSGAHPSRPSCLKERIDATANRFRRDGFEYKEEWVLDQVARLVEIIDSGACPRCGDPFEEPPVMPAGSRSTSCRCIPVCGQCGFREMVSGGTVRSISGPSLWPLDRIDISADDEAGELLLSTSSPAVLAGGQVLSEDGVAPLVVKFSPTGGWREYGYDSSVDDDERRGR